MANGVPSAECPIISTTFPLSTELTLTVKVAHGDDTHRLPLHFEIGTTAGGALAIVWQAVRRAFELLEGANHVLRYRDAEGDCCTLTAFSMADLAMQSSAKVWRLDLEVGKAADSTCNSACASFELPQPCPEPDQEGDAHRQSMEAVFAIQQTIFKNVFEPAFEASRKEDAKDPCKGRRKAKKDRKHLKDMAEWSKLWGGADMADLSKLWGGADMADLSKLGDSAGMDEFPTFDWNQYDWDKLDWSKCQWDRFGDWAQHLDVEGGASNGSDQASSEVPAAAACPRLPADQRIPQSLGLDSASSGCPLASNS